ncbi:MAG: acyl-CoA dehydrogenase family protein, partial [Gemmatimonadetes bacterium]|nr:acyl-CoA dehydrogenase family protein [Gemmatimonadota bacterium]
MAGKFQGVDFYDVDSLLAEEERMVRDTIREWVEDRVLPIIADAYMEYRFPEELIPRMAEMGVLGSNLPEE